MKIIMLNSKPSLKKLEDETELVAESKKQPFDIPKSNRSKGRAKGQAVPFSSFKQPKPKKQKIRRNTASVRARNL